MNTSGGETFSNNQLINTKLMLKTETKNNFLVGDENFTDSIKLKIISN